MSSPPPTLADKYRLTTAHETSREVFNAILEDIANHLLAVVGLPATMQALQQAGVSGAVAYIIDTVSPQLQAALDDLATMQATITSAQGQLMLLQNAGVPAGNVPIAPIAGIAASNTQQAIAELKGALDAQIAAARRINRRTYFMGG